MWPEFESPEKVFWYKIWFSRVFWLSFLLEMIFKKSSMIFLVEPKAKPEINYETFLKSLRGEKNCQKILETQILWQKNFLVTRIQVIMKNEIFFHDNTVVNLGQIRVQFVTLTLRWRNLKKQKQIKVDIWSIYYSNIISCFNISQNISQKGMPRPRGR